MMPALTNCFDFSIEPMIIGEVKHYSFSDSQGITNFKNGEEIQETLLGRLFHGSIDEIELLTDEKSNTHPNLVKLYGYCFDRRLAAIYDEKLTTVLSNMILADSFGWDERLKVETQLVELLAWLNEKRIAVGSVTAACIMMDGVSLNP
ncbi:hypothetical protein HAX54_046761 [Datura stramonium]|uniref:Uncharacterized protein n=1 Tax=Datura stramonium TaxID=4076 RepID=A0ABS8WHJ0_DATST|nr:hypothetical protein [Datura stramonium]